ncbi:SU10 major capsid protein [Campylobacter gastrosuis]|uniref:DUF5309 domain-containing protein n=1 Tax=Campylobacter gastrosuis TaxID=2974576 RepID=A0ABT7HPB9_9BACT|nr:DUF5309 family protein [Campylobacter gastrosuis]MDL0088490.1 DUF5309 domain-containing protein [Campylobacter gastrosuis]
MAVKTGLITSEEAFGTKGVYLENTIKRIGWQQTPFLSTISTAAPADRSTNVALGHSWYYDEIPTGDKNNAHVEGGAAAQIKYFTGSSLKNHFQIVKNGYGVSGTEEHSTRVNGSAKLATQGELSSLEHKLSIEQILLSDQAAVARVNSGGSLTAGKCGGLKSFATSVNTIDAAGAELDMQLIRNLLKIGFFKNRPYQYLMVKDTQNDKLLALLDKYKQANYKVKQFDDEVLAINSSYGTNIKIILNPFLAENEIIAYRSDDIVKVNWRAMKTREIPTSDDAIKKEIISEFTLRVCTPVAFAWLKNLKV